VRALFISRLAAVCVLLFVSIAASTATADTGAAQSSRYHFALLVDQDRDAQQHVGLRPGVSINDKGTVAFVGGVAGGSISVYTADGKSQSQLTTQQDCPSLDCFATSINGAGTVAFIGAKSDALDERQITTVFTADGRTVNHVVDARDLDRRNVSINEQGAVAFSRLSRTEGGVFVSQGTALTRISDHGALFAQPVVNNQGAVAFFDFSPRGTAIVTGNGGPLTAVVHDRTEDFPAFVLAPAGTLAFNDKGNVVFVSWLRRGKMGVVKASEGTFQTIADSTDAFIRFSMVALNNKGEVAFQASLRTPAPNSSGRGIFTGPDPVADKVVAAGDPLFGSTVTDIEFWRDGLNEAGEIAFMATLADGRQVIGRACPIPAGAVRQDTQPDNSYLRAPF
jgi:hypothetical protein